MAIRNSERVKRFVGICSLHIHRCLKNIYGSMFYYLQACIDGILRSRDQLVVMATGSGKSLCYQLPPLVLGKPAIIISPLISLMQDQVMALEARGLRACYLGSAQMDPMVEADAWAGRYQFIYITPELAMSRMDSLASLRDGYGMSLVAVDEAHCVCEWGHDFRAEYRQLAVVKRRLAGVPFVALTATATPAVREDIMSNLELGPDVDTWVDSFERPNLRLEVRRKGQSMATSLLPLLQGVGAGGAIEPTIIYTISRKEAGDVAALLHSQPGLEGKVGVYHGELPPAERSRVHAAFIRDQLPIVCCTLAFGMGVDKPNVRRVIHWGCPSSLESYYQ